MQALTVFKLSTLNLLVMVDEERRDSRVGKKETRVKRESFVSSIEKYD
jgi:hypothetical protein